MATVDDRYDKLKKSVEYPEHWKPEKGDTLVGRALDWETVTPKPDEDRTCEVLVVREEDGTERSVWCGHAQLRYKLIADKEALEASGDLTGAAIPVEERKVQPGDFVAIHFRGKFPMPDGNYEAASYRLGTERPQEGEDEIPF
jgi:hypothetical protein